MTVAQIANFALDNNKPDIYKKAIKKGREISLTDEKRIIGLQRYYKDYGNTSWRQLSDWTSIIKLFPNKGQSKKIEERSVTQNKKDYDAARKKINTANTLYGFYDVTTDRQEKNGTMLFKLRTKTVVPSGDIFSPRIRNHVVDYSITKKGYVRRHSQGNSSPIYENPYLTYQQLADILLAHLAKNKHKNKNES